MKRILSNIAASTFIVLTMLSCSKEQSNDGSVSEGFEYATLITMSEKDGYTDVIIADPWNKGKVLQHLALVERESTNKNFGEDITVINVPIERTVVMSSVHGSLLAELGCIDAVKGICDTEYIKDEAITKGLNDGSIADAGNSMQPVVEQIMAAMPEVVMISPFQGEDYEKYNTMQKPLIKCADYMEPTAMGRAEWILFYGKLMSKEEKADSIFNSVKTHYNKLANICKDLKEKPLVLSEMPYGDVWYMPAVKSTIGKLYDECGGRLAIKDKGETGSVQLAPERVLIDMADADVWLFKGDKDLTLNTMAEVLPMATQIKAHKEGNVWQCNTIKSMLYEETPFHPDRLLEDFICIFHPEIQKKHNLKLHYYRKIK